MTTPSTARKAGPLLGNGSTTAFPFTFKVFAAADVAVTIANSSGVETPLVLNTDYSVTLNGNQDTSPGGTITYPISGAALPSGSKLSIVGDLDYDQPLDLPSGGNFSPTALENQLDRATMQIQQLAEGLSRAAKLPVTNSEDPATLVADIVRLADSADNIDTLVANLADIATVADDLNEPVSEINTVAGAITNVNNVGSNITNVNTVAGISANVTTVAAIDDDVTAVAGVAANVTTVAGVSAAVTAVAAIDDDVTIAAANVADITNFADVYQGPKTSDPTLRNDGSALQVGDLYFNTTNDEMRVYGGTLWKSGFAGTVGVQQFSGNGSTVAFTLATAPAGENNTQVYIGGVYQQKDQYSVSGTTLTFSTAPPSGTNNVEVVTISTLAIGETDASLVAFLQAGTGAIERTAQAKLREFVSVKDFGAVGDDITNDTPAIQAAIDAVQSGGGGQIFLPPGIYRINAPLTISGAVPLWLTGSWASVIKNIGTTASIVVGNASADQTSDVRIHNIQIYGNASSSHGINMIRMHSSRIEGVRVQFHGGDGILMQGCYASWLLNSYSNNNGGSGLNAKGLAAAGNDFLQVIGNKFLANASRGIFIDNTLYGPAGQRIELNDVEGNAVGLQVNVGSGGNTEGMTIRGNYFENNTGSTMSVAEDGGAAVINSPMVEGNAFMFGTVSSSVNDVRFGSKVRQLNLVGNNFVTSNLVINNAATLGIVSGNKSNATVPGGFDANGGMTVSQLRLWQPGGGAYSAISMSGGIISANYPMQTGGEFYPASANTAASQTACGMWAGSGAPNNAYGANGHVYFRSDTPTTANQRIYVKNGGTWVGVV